MNNKQFTYVFAKFYNGCFALPMSTEPIDTGKGTWLTANHKCIKASCICGNNFYIRSVDMPLSVLPLSLLSTLFTCSIAEAEITS